jgi:hypothetical protein
MVPINERVKVICLYKDWRKGLEDPAVRGANCQSPRNQIVEMEEVGLAALCWLVTRTRHVQVVLQWVREEKKCDRALARQAERGLSWKGCCTDMREARFGVNNLKEEVDTLEAVIMRHM